MKQEEALRIWETSVGVWRACHTITLLQIGGAGSDEQAASGRSGRRPHLRCPVSPQAALPAAVRRQRLSPKAPEQWILTLPKSWPKGKGRGSGHVLFPDLNGGCKGVVSQ